MVLGELCAFATASSLACSQTICSFNIKHSGPIRMSFLRIVVCLILYMNIILVTNSTVIPKSSFQVYLLIVTSGVVGQGIGDTLLLITIEKIGDRNAVLIEALAPILTGIVSYFYNGHSVGQAAWIGMAISTIGVLFTVINQQRQKDENERQKQLLQYKGQLIESEGPQSDMIGVALMQCSIKKIINTRIQKCLKRDNLLIGLLCGFGWSACQALGVVLSYDAIHKSTLSPLQIANIRLLSGAVMVLTILLCTQNSIFIWPWQTRKLNLLFALQLILSPFIEVWAQQLSLVYTLPEVAQTIIATAPLIELVIEYFRGEIIKYQYVFGSFISVVGIGIIIWF